MMKIPKLPSCSYLAWLTVFLLAFSCAIAAPDDSPEPYRGSRDLDLDSGEKETKRQADLDAEAQRRAEAAQRQQALDQAKQAFANDVRQVADVERARAAFYLGIKVDQPAIAFLSPRQRKAHAQRLLASGPPKGSLLPVAKQTGKPALVQQARSIDAMAKQVQEHLQGTALQVCNLVFEEQLEKLRAAPSIDKALTDEMNKQVYASLYDIGKCTAAITATFAVPTLERFKDRAIKYCNKRVLEVLKTSVRLNALQWCSGKVKEAEAARAASSPVPAAGQAAGKNSDAPYRSDPDTRRERRERGNAPQGDSKSGSPPTNPKGGKGEPKLPGKEVPPTRPHKEPSPKKDAPTGPPVKGPA